MATAVRLGGVKQGPGVACSRLGGARPKQRNAREFVLKELKIGRLKGESKAQRAAWRELLWSSGEGQWRQGSLGIGNESQGPGQAAADLGRGYACPEGCVFLGC